MQDEIPESVARVIGYVCGVIAVGMAILGLLAIWGAGAQAIGSAHVRRVVLRRSFVSDVSLGRRVARLLGCARSAGGVEVLLFGVRRAVRRARALSVAATSVRPPLSLDEGLLVVIGISGGVALIYLCYLAYRRFK